MPSAVGPARSGTEVVSRHERDTCWTWIFDLAKASMRTTRSQRLEALAGPLPFRSWKAATLLQLGPRAHGVPELRQAKHRGPRGLDQRGFPGPRALPEDIPPSRPARPCRRLARRSPSRRIPRRSLCANLALGTPQAPFDPASRWLRTSRPRNGISSPVLESTCSLHAHAKSNRARRRRSSNVATRCPDDREAACRRGGTGNLPARATYEASSPAWCSRSESATCVESVPQG